MVGAIEGAEGTSTFASCSSNVRSRGGNSSVVSGLSISRKRSPISSQIAREWVTLRLMSAVLLEDMVWLL